MQKVKLNIAYGIVHFPQKKVGKLIYLSKDKYCFIRCQRKVIFLERNRFFKGNT